jgi:hypothetical protein
MPTMAILSTELRDLVGSGTPRRIVASAKGSGLNQIDATGRCRLQPLLQRLFEGLR